MELPAKLADKSKLRSLKCAACRSFGHKDGKGYCYYHQHECKSTMRACAEVRVRRPR